MDLLDLPSSWRRHVIVIPTSENDLPLTWLSECSAAKSLNLRTRQTAFPNEKPLWQGLWKTNRWMPIPLMNTKAYTSYVIFTSAGKTGPSVWIYKWAPCMDRIMADVQTLFIFFSLALLLSWCHIWLPKDISMHRDTISTHFCSTSIPGFSWRRTIWFGNLALSAL